MQDVLAVSKPWIITYLIGDIVFPFEQQNGNTVVPADLPC
jgi:hypothetical protein